MSLINQMLKDIDKRHGLPNASSPVPGGVPLMGKRSRSGHDVARWVLGGAALLALVAGVGWFQQAFKPVQVPPMAARPLAATSVPAAVPPVAVVQTPASAMPPVLKADAPESVPAEPAKQPAVARAPEPRELSKPAVPQSAALAPSAPVAEAADKPVARLPAPPGQVTRVVSAEQRADNTYREAVAWLRQGRSEDAHKAFKQALSEQPTHVEARLLYARSLQDLGQTAQAKALLSEGMALKPQAFALHAALAQMQLLGQEAEQAVATLERGLPAAGDNAGYQALLATALQQQSRHAEAVQHYVTALRQQPDASNWLVGLGVSLQAQGNTQGAAEAFQRALDLGLPASLSQFARERLQQLSR